jgi:hypothetical protein
MHNDGQSVSHAECSVHATRKPEQLTEKEFDRIIKLRAQA